MQNGTQLETPHTHVHRVSRRLLEPAQDLIVLGIGLALFGLMARSLIYCSMRSSSPAAAPAAKGSRTPVLPASGPECPGQHPSTS